MRLLRLLAVSSAVCAVAATSLSCAVDASTPASGPVTAAPTPAADVVSPALTRAVEDIYRQSQHLATIIASRPTEAPLTGVGSLGGAGQAFQRPTPVGVWWWRGTGGDFTSFAALEGHPYAAYLDLLDGVLDYHEPFGYHDSAGVYYRETVSRMLLQGVLPLFLASGALAEEPDAVLQHEIAVAIGDALGWEVVDVEQPLVRYWASWDWEGRSYRLGAVVRFSVERWPYGVGQGTPFVEGAIPMEVIGPPVLERVK